MTMTTDHTYTCSACGAHDFTVENESFKHLIYTVTLTCTCEADAGIAHIKTFEVEDSTFRTGPLDDLHQVQEWDEHEPDRYHEDIVDEEVNCQSCCEDASGDDYETIVDDEVPLGHLDRWRVRCDGCGRLIPFGWSHPARGGRIWPVDSVDHIPGKAWPEPSDWPDDSKRSRPLDA